MNADSAGNGCGRVGLHAAITSLLAGGSRAACRLGEHGIPDAAGGKAFRPAGQGVGADAVARLALFFCCAWGFSIAVRVYTGS